MNDLANQMGSPFYQNSLDMQILGMHPGQLGMAANQMASINRGLLQGLSPRPPLPPSIQEEMELDVREWLSDWDK